MRTTRWVNDPLEKRDRRHAARYPDAIYAIIAGDAGPCRLDTVLFGLRWTA
jgi:hypothetical protein